MRILIFGKSGQVGCELARIRWPHHITVHQLGRNECNVEDFAAIAGTIRNMDPDLVINAAAYTAVDRAESEPYLAAKVNRDAPGVMARECAKLHASFIQLSTDYVFDGTKTSPYHEDDSTAPLSVYGRTKAEGEVAVRDEIPTHVIMRTSWVFAAHGANFVRSMLRLGRERPELRIVDDQKGSPTAARDIAVAIASIVDAIAGGQGSWGTFHFTSSEATTWYGFARAIIEQARLVTKVTPITTAEYPTAARRPANSVLDCRRIANGYGVPQPDWRRSLATVLSELANRQLQTRIPGDEPAAC